MLQFVNNVACNYASARALHGRRRYLCVAIRATFCKVFKMIVTPITLPERDLISPGEGGSFGNFLKRVCERRGVRLRHQEVNFFANGDWRETSACGQRDHTPTCLGLHVADSTGLGSTARGESKGKAKEKTGSDGLQSGEYLLNRWRPFLQMWNAWCLILCIES